MTEPEIRALVRDEMARALALLGREVARCGSRVDVALKAAAMSVRQPLVSNPLTSEEIDWTQEPNLPRDTLPARWRSTGSGLREQRLIFSLSTPQGIARFALPPHDARVLSEDLMMGLGALHDYLLRTATQSGNSSETPSDDVSTPDECRSVCPPEKSSRACRGDV